MVVSMLYKLLLGVKRDLGKLPAILHLSMDNCWRENKNRFVLSFLAALVQQNILAEVNVTFLLVGHTVRYDKNRNVTLLNIDRNMWIDNSGMLNDNREVNCNVHFKLLGRILGANLVLVKLLDTPVFP